MVGVVARRAVRLVLTAMVTLILLPGSEAVGAALPVSASIAVGDTGHFAYDVAPRVAAALGSGAEAVESHPLAAGHAGSANMAAEDAAHLYDFQSDFVAPNSTRIFRAVEPDELADLRSFGQYRAGGPHAEWLDGKRFWLSQTDADAYVALATKADLGGPYCVTSGCIPNSVLDQIQVVTMDGMDAVFLPNELLPFINDLSLPSPP